MTLSKIVQRERVIGDPSFCHEYCLSYVRGWMGGSKVSLAKCHKICILQKSSLIPYRIFRIICSAILTLFIHTKVEYTPFITKLDFLGGQQNLLKDKLLAPQRLLSSSFFQAKNILIYFSIYAAFFNSIKKSRLVGLSQIVKQTKKE